jgi:serine/threonine-protein kinase
MTADDSHPREYLDETVDGFPIDSSSYVGIDRPRVELITGSSPELITETEGLLRSRLRLMTTMLLVIFTAFYIRLFLGMEEDYHLTPFTEFFRVFLQASLAILTIILWSRRDFSMLELRAFEVFAFGLVGIFFFLVHIAVLKNASSPQFNPELREAQILSGVYLSIIMWFSIAVMYGSFIPNALWRGVLVNGILCLMPLAELVVAARLFPRSAEALNASVVSVTALSMAIGFVLATYGTHKITSLRQQAFEARRLGQYRLTEFLGAGGMGEVYLAEHQMLKRPCAIKLVRSGSLADGKALARFEREVRAMARLTHWNTVEVFDYGCAEDGSFYYVMEFLPGMSLQEVVEQQGPLQPERAAYLLRQVTEALIEAHSVGLIHRDIKPSNIIASRRGGRYDVAKLLDFGLAAYVDEMQDIRLTQEGAIAGSPYYMAPERFLENDEPDAGCDIYSLGATAYYLLTGRPPFVGEKPLQVMVAHAREEVVPPTQYVPAIPADLEAVVMRCLEKDPSGRFKNVAELEQALDQCQCTNQWTQEFAQQWWSAKTGIFLTDDPTQASLLKLMRTGPSD